jgi:hypothetical protein
MKTWPHLSRQTVERTEISVRHAANATLLTRFAWRLLFSFRSVLEVFDAGRFLAA